VPTPNAEFFRECGYWQGESVLDEFELSTLIFELENVRRGEYRTGNAPSVAGWDDGTGLLDLVQNLGFYRDLLNKQENCWISSDYIRGIATKKRLAAMSADLLGNPVRLWQDKYFYKPGNGTSHFNTVDWHQDYNWWRAACPAELVSAWIPLDPVSELNGSLALIPGSHKWGWSEGLSTCGGFDREAQETRIRQHEPHFRAITISARAGDVVFHHCLTVHSSGRNLSPAPRRAYVIVFQSTRCYWSPDSVTSKLHFSSREMERLGKLPGDPFEGPLWPEIQTEIHT
jgi:phytanoyl-CoA hydroxylase